MNGLERFERWYYRNRAKWGRRRRMIFPSPLELEFVELMGGKVWRSKRIRDRKRNFPLAIILSMGPVLGGENMKREVRYGRYFVDFSNDVNRVIEIDGAQYHMDVVADMDREIYLTSKPYNCRILRIKTYEIRNQPDRVQQKTMKFLTY
jgi:very-short-patch-repair endonuclease